MGETAADTAREVIALRAETERLLDAIERRARDTLDVRQQVAGTQLVKVAAGAAVAVAGAAVLALWIRSLRQARAARRPGYLLERELQAFGDEALQRTYLVAKALRSENDAREAQPAPVSTPKRVLRGLVAGATLAGGAYLAGRLAKPQWSTRPPSTLQGPPSS